MDILKQQLSDPAALQDHTHVREEKQQRSLKWAAGTAAAAALYLTPASDGHLNADIVHVTSGFTENTSLEWDIDGDGGNDFLVRSGQTGYSTVYYQVNLNSHDGRNGRGVVNFGAGSTDDDVQNLPLGFQIGNALATGYAWGASGQGDRNLISAGVTTFTNSGGSVWTHHLGQDAQGFTLDQSGYIGFRFESAGDLLYGWARVTLNTFPDYGSLTVHEWAYNDTAGGSILVGQTSSAVPEPGSLGGLAALACGAAGLRRSRRRRNMD